MARTRNHRHGVPRTKRMNRSARIQSAVPWLKEFKGKNILRGYCKRYGVDWRCAAIELKQLGIELDPAYLSQREQSEQQLISERRGKRQAVAGEDSLPNQIEYELLFDAYLAKDFPTVHAMECEKDGVSGVEPDSTDCASE